MIDRQLCHDPAWSPDGGFPLGCTRTALHSGHHRDSVENYIWSDGQTPERTS